MPENIQINGLNDSKKISAKMRDRLDIEIRKKAIGFGIGIADVAEIDRINILQATFKAMERAIDALPTPPDYILVDGRDFPGFIFKGAAVSGEALVKGDSKSAVIAGASILAKVYRDNLMMHYAEVYPDYGFEQHKGYGTKLHRENILEFGPCILHRKKFLRKILHSEQ